MKKKIIIFKRTAMLAGILLAVLSFYSVLRLSNGPKTAGNQSAVGDRNNSNRQSKIDRQNLNILRVGWTAWADAEVVSLMAKKVIEAHYNKEVELVMADIGIQYESVARGDLDIMLMAWLPRTHQQYWKKVWNRVNDLGPMYTGKLGWVVPDYVPIKEISSIVELKESNISENFGNKVQGIDPGSGLMQMSEKALKVYNLSNLELISASGAAMTAVLDRAIRENNWVVVTSWTPHWMFARYKLRFLEDPKKVFGGKEGIHAITRIGLDQDHPKVVNLLSRYRLREEELADLLLKAQETSPQIAVDNYLKTNKNKVKYWVTGEISE